MPVDFTERLLAAQTAEIAKKNRLEERQQELEAVRWQRERQKRAEALERYQMLDSREKDPTARITMTPEQTAELVDAKNQLWGIFSPENPYVQAKAAPVIEEAIAKDISEYQKQAKDLGTYLDEGGRTAHLNQWYGLMKGKYGDHLFRFFNDISGLDTMTTAAREAQQPIGAAGGLAIPPPGSSETKSAEGPAKGAETTATATGAETGATGNPNQGNAYEMFRAVIAPGFGNATPLAQQPKQLDDALKELELLAVNPDVPPAAMENLARSILSSPYARSTGYTPEVLQARVIQARRNAYQKAYENLAGLYKGGQRSPQMLVQLAQLQLAIAGAAATPETIGEAATKIDEALTPEKEPRLQALTDAMIERLPTLDENGLQTLAKVTGRSPAELKSLARNPSLTLFYRMLGGAAYGPGGELKTKFATQRVQLAYQYAVEGRKDPFKEADDMLKEERDFGLRLKNLGISQAHLGIALRGETLAKKKLQATDIKEVRTTISALEEEKRRIMRGETLYQGQTGKKETSEEYATRQQSALRVLDDLIETLTENMEAIGGGVTVAGGLRGEALRKRAGY